MKSGTATIIGRPNSGKSTLLNSIVGQKISIVSDKPQTTRNRIIGVFGDERGQIAFVDTPGIHKPRYRMNERMLRIVRDSFCGVDLILLVVDGSVAFGSGEEFTLEMVRSSAARAFLLINKIDKVAKPKILPIIQRYNDVFGFLETIPISAVQRDNVNLLIDKVFEYLPEGVPFYSPDEITDRTERFLAAELIREKILERTREEIPYATAVLLGRFDESKRDSKKLVVIDADILVERRSQQGIVLGAGGCLLRDAGTAARHDIEQLLGCRVYLNLSVRTESRWRDNEAVLDRLELGS